MNVKDYQRSYKEITGSDLLHGCRWDRGYGASEGGGEVGGSIPGNCCGHWERVVSKMERSSRQQDEGFRRKEKLDLSWE